MAQPRLKMRLGDLLVQEQIISDDQLQLALQQQRQTGRKLGTTLIDLGFISEVQLLTFLARQLDVPFFDLNNLTIDVSAVTLLPEVQARRYRALAVNLSDDKVTVVMSDPADLSALDAIAALLSPRELVLAVAREGQLLEYFDRLYRRTREIENFAVQLHEEHQETGFELGAGSLNAATDEGEATVAKLLRSLFEDAVQVGASDIHIEPDEKVLRIRQRIDGVLHENILSEVRIAQALVLRLKLVAGLDISEKRLPQDGRFNMKVRGRDVDVRMSTMPVQYGESVVMRLLDQSSGILSLAETGMPPAILTRFRRQLKRPHGMILVTGPTGSGKTTTLYGALSELNQASHKIITVEDPVEFQLPGITQVQTHADIGLDFASVLRSMLRQDPDVVMVGEIRDRETAEIAIQAALTGHLVLSTVHTNDSLGAFTRLIDMGVEPFLVATPMRGLQAQRLVRRLCPHCAVPAATVLPAIAGETARWAHQVLGDAPAQWMQAVGCPRCQGTGYRGRIGIYELVPVDETMQQAVVSGATHLQLKAMARERGCRFLREDGLLKAWQGITTVDEVLRVTAV